MALIESKKAIEEFKAYKNGDCMNDCEHYDNCSNYTYSKGYNKAIDDFIRTLMPRLTDAIYQKDVWGMCNLINDVARELKAGDENEID